MSSNNKNIWIHGISGKMGQNLQQTIVDTQQMQVLGGSTQQDCSQLEKNLNNIDLIVDFSTIDGNTTLIEILSEDHPKIPCVLICTTGLSQKQIEHWQLLANKTPVLLAPNTSLGIFLLNRLAKQARSLLQQLDFDIQIEETHHRHKKDSPSGTALFLAEQLEQEMCQDNLLGSKNKGEHRVEIHSTRGGGVFGQHSIRFLGEFEELTISHQSFSRGLFSKGALKMGSWLMKQPKGFYTLESLTLSDLTAQ